MEKHMKINTMTTRTTNGCGYSSDVVTFDIVPSRANPPGGAIMLYVYFISQLLCFFVVFLIQNNCILLVL